MESAYRRALSIQQYREAVGEATREIQRRVALAEIPENLHADLQERMKSHPSLPWDEALEQILPSNEDLEEDPEQRSKSRVGSESQSECSP